MSWILGCINKYENQELDLSLFLKRKDILFNFKTNKLHLLAGGNKSNLHYKTENDLILNSSTNWLVIGIGMKSTNNSSILFNNDEWDRFIENPILENINGHFVILKWNVQSMYIYTDVLGMRDIYLLDTKDKIFFSTRIDWIAHFNKININYKEFGSRWLLLNQLSKKSIFENVVRIVAGKSASINFNDNSIQYEDYNWLPNLNGNIFSESEFKYNLKNILFIRERNNIKNISISLSGGLDSRVLLSLLLNSSNIKWNTFNIGDLKHPDSIVVKKITDKLKIEHLQIIPDFDFQNSIIDNLIDFSAQSLVSNPISKFLQLGNYNLVQKYDSIVIDGGFGEIWRREFFNKIIWQDRKAKNIYNKNFLLNKLSNFRADIFNNDLLNIMKQGCEEQLEEIYDLFPTINDIGLENWFDLLAIKIKLPNYFLHEQSRTDNFVQSFTAFIQISLLKNLFLLPNEIKKNRKLFKNIINDNFFSKQNYMTSINKFPLVKGDVIYPFYFNSFQMRIWSMIQKKILKKNFIDDIVPTFFNKYKSYVFDLLNSKDIKYSEIYDFDKVNKLINNYYNGNSNLLNSLDWFLSFELFRQGIENK